MSGDSKAHLSTSPIGKLPGRSSFTLPIRLRLPILFALLLLSVIAVSTWSAYTAVRNSTLALGTERLRHLTDQLSTLLQQSSNTLTTRTQTIANEESIREYLRSGSDSSRIAAINLLKTFTASQDESNLGVELWTVNLTPALTVPKQISPDASELQPEFIRASKEPYKTVGSFRVVEGTVVYPLVAAVRSGDGQPLGFLVRWRKLFSNPQARKQFTELVGNQGTLYFGNAEGPLWTDMVKIVPKPQTKLTDTTSLIRYEREGSSFTALGKPILGTPWFLLMEFPDQAFMSQAKQFLRRMLIIGAVVFLLGLGISFLLSRSITRPLNLLKVAAARISAGDYQPMVTIDRKDELGELARAFNAMATRVRESQADLERRIAARTSELESANQELESFSYSVSHDLRSPLRAIDGYSRVIREDFKEQLPADALLYLARIENGASRMATLIDDLLALSRLGRQPLQKQAVSAGNLVREVWDELQAEHQDRDITVTVDELPSVQADPALLKQVYVNLVSNALKYTRDQPQVSITIGCTPANGNGSGPIFFVSDNGVGFDMQYADQLFGVFQRLHRADEFEGTGVGLAIVQRIIRRHGGRVWAEAEVGRGARFSFQLPTV